jgi:hypothetical protein
MAPGESLERSSRPDDDGGEVLLVPAAFSAAVFQANRGFRLGQEVEGGGLDDRHVGWPIG